MSVSGVILAAGSGTRFGGPEAKAWTHLAGRPLLWHAIDAFARSGGVDELVVVVRNQDKIRVASLPPVGVPVHAVVGGERRADSSLAGISASQGEVVLVHDGARPLVTPDLILRTLEAARRHGAAVPVLPLSDTVRYADAHFLKNGIVDRFGLVLVQTPQGFSRPVLVHAYAEASRQGLDLPDDAAAVLAVGHPVATVPGDPTNLKITRPEDLFLAERMLALAR